MSKYLSKIIFLHFIPKIDFFYLEENPMKEDIYPSPKAIFDLCLLAKPSIC
jgi:hypothetical protein